jgi:hypothetical protein
MPHAKIKIKQAKLTLEQLHAELGGKILDNKAEAESLRQAMVHVEMTLKLLDPTHNLRAIAVRRRKPNEWFRRGTILRAALDVLRKSKAPMTVSEITAAMLDVKGITDAPRSAVANLEGSVRSSLWNHTGKTVKTAGDDSPARWNLLT